MRFTESALRRFWAPPRIVPAIPVACGRASSDMSLAELVDIARSINRARSMLEQLNNQLVAKREQLTELEARVPGGPALGETAVERISGSCGWHPSKTESRTLSTMAVLAAARSHAGAIRSPYDSFGGL
jgi:hypothetical protein